MKTHIFTVIFLLMATFTITAQPPIADVFRLDYIKCLTKEEIYQQYAYDDTSRALIDKFYSSQLQAAALIGINAALTTGIFIIIYPIIPFMSLSYYDPISASIIGVEIALFAGTVGSFFLIPSKSKLLNSLKYYREKGILKVEDRRWIRGYMPSE